MTGNSTYKRILIGLIVLASVLPLWATEYVVTTRTEFNALNLVAGDLVILKNGTWEDVSLEFKGTGTASQPITLRAETPGQVVFSGNSSLEIGGSYLIVDGLVFQDGYTTNGHVIAFRTNSSNLANNCRLTNTKILNYNPSSRSTEYKWVSLYGQNNRVDHCHFQGKDHAGAMLVIWLDENPNYHQIDHNYFGPRPDLGVNGGETIRVGTSDWSMYDSHTIVEYNLFDECDGEIEIISNKSCKNIYRYNTFRNSEGTLTLRHGNECEVHSNFFFGDPEKDCGGIRIIGEDHRVYNNYLQEIPGTDFRAAISLTNGVPNSPLNRYFQVKNALVVNNTLVNCYQPFSIGSGKSSELSLPPLNCEIANNVIAVYTSGTSKIINYVDTPENMVYQKNIMYGANLGIAPIPGILEENPDLLEGAVWRPSESSIVIDYGSTGYSFVSHDIDGQTRGPSNDAGCDQGSTGTILNKPLTIADVGVTWVSTIKEVAEADGGAVLKGYIDNAEDGDVI